MTAKRPRKIAWLTPRACYRFPGARGWGGERGDNRGGMVLVIKGLPACWLNITQAQPKRPKSIWQRKLRNNKCNRHWRTTGDLYMSTAPSSNCGRASGRGGGGGVRYRMTLNDRGG